MNMMFKHITAKAYTFCICLLFLSSIVSCNKDKTYKKVSSEKEVENLYKKHLRLASKLLDSVNIIEDIEAKKNLFKVSRNHFKLSEPILAYADKENYETLNSPNLLRIREEDPTDIKIDAPIGYQVIEETLFDDNLDKATLKDVVNKTSKRLQLILNNAKLTLKNYHTIWLVRDAIVRVATTGLSNFDSPVLGQSLQESSKVYETLIKIIDLHQENFENKSLLINFKKELQASIKLLQSSEFDSFDRYNFIKNHTNKQLKDLVTIQNDWKVRFPFELALKNDVSELFSPNTFNVYHFSDYLSDTTNLKQKVLLGKTLFNDVSLSENNSMSCATCHNKDKAFTDGKKTFDKNQLRNTPTLTYASLQQNFFYDKRAGSLEGQIINVVNNHHEFNSDITSIIKRLQSNKKYQQAFDSLYSNKLNNENLRHAIASYIRSLNSFNSKFDRNIANKENSLTESEKNGFNLFMGKGACATCHFPPAFNGTVPPRFKETELEVLGVPKEKKWKNAIVDSDLGRYEVFKTEERKHAFKTPTIRNIEKTAPYMHNGVYDNLQEVMKFYNVGGGQGIGIELENQTLPFDNLNLTDNEISDIIAFMKTLTDK